MIVVGDLISMKDSLWRAVHRDRMTRTVILEQWDGTREEIPNDLDMIEGEGVKKICHPPTDWPFALAKSKPSSIVGIIRVRGTREQRLVPLVDWALTDRKATGGAVFFNPHLRLGYGDVLTVVHANEARGQITIPVSFGTHNQRQERKAAKNRKPVTAYDRLLGDDPYDD